MFIAHVLVPDPCKPQAFFFLIILLWASYSFFKGMCKNNSELKNWMAAVGCCLVMTGLYYIPKALDYIFESAWYAAIFVFLPLIVISLVASQKVKSLRRFVLTILICLTFSIIFYLYGTFSVKSIPCGRPENVMRTDLATLGSALEQYRGKYAKYPDNLQELVDTRYIESISSASSGEWNYIKLPANAPKGLIFMWVKPNTRNQTSSDALKTIEVRKNKQGFVEIKLADLEAEIQRTRKWVAENATSTTQPGE